MIVVEPVEDGGNPRDPADIRRFGSDHFRVMPYSEDGDDNYTFALHVRAHNAGSAMATLTLEIDWGDQAYMPSRRFIHVRRGGDWEIVPVAVEGSLARVSLQLPPGEASIGLSPAYGLLDHAAFLARLQTEGGRRDVVGQSAQGHAIEALSFGTGPRRVLVTARFHPYETAASWCAEGLISWLATGDAGQERLRRQATLTVVPMPNPDGVALGLCKRTGPGGADLSHEAAGSDDVAARALMGLIDTLRPAAFLDVHGWMHVDEDGLHFYDAGLAGRFQRATAAQPELAGNRWRGYEERPSGGSPRWYSHLRYGTQALAVSYRWPGRTLAQMRAVGAATLRAFLTAIG